DFHVTGVQTCALPICRWCGAAPGAGGPTASLQPVPAVAESAGQAPQPKALDKPTVRQLAVRSAWLPVQRLGTARTALPDTPAGRSEERRVGHVRKREV